MSSRGIVTTIQGKIYKERLKTHPKPQQVKPMDDLFDDWEQEEEEEYMLDEVSGRKRKSVMSLLNKTELSKHEMDDIFTS